MLVTTDGVGVPEASAVATIEQIRASGDVPALPDTAATRVQIEQMLKQLQEAANTVARMQPSIEPLRKVMEAAEAVGALRSRRDVEDGETTLAMLDIMEMCGAQLLQLNEIVLLVQAERVERGEQP